LETRRSDGPLGGGGISSQIGMSMATQRRKAATPFLATVEYSPISHARRCRRPAREQVACEFGSGNTARCWDRDRSRINHQPANWQPPDVTGSKHSVGHARSAWARPVVTGLRVRGVSARGAAAGRPLTAQGRRPYVSADNGERLQFNVSCLLGLRAVRAVTALPQLQVLMGRDKRKEAKNNHA